MAFTASTENHPPGPPGRRRVRWTITSLALALFGLLTITPVVGDAAGARSAAAAVPVAGGESGIVRAPVRVCGLESAKRPLELDDGDDPPQHAAAVTLLRPCSGWSAVGSAVCRTDVDASRRPLRDRPQSPRAPPSLA